jgi:methionyl-tRNA synthetase
VAEGRFYITTPIYYPSDVLHIGHAYTTVYCDALARWHRFKGEKVFFLTGSDEHGQKIERAAAVQGKDPKEYVDAIVATFQALWKRLGVSYDDFIRTTEPRHTQVVQAIFRQLYEQGDIYSSKYEGWYCTPCETFCVENRLVDGNCPDCGRTNGASLGCQVDSLHSGRRSHCHRCPGSLSGCRGGQLAQYQARDYGGHGDRLCARCLVPGRHSCRTPGSCWARRSSLQTRGVKTTIDPCTH